MSPLLSQNAGTDKSAASRAERRAIRTAEKTSRQVDKLLKKREPEEIAMDSDQIRGIRLEALSRISDDTVLARLAQLTGSNPGVIYGQTQLVDAQRDVVGRRHLTAPRRLTAASFLNGMVVCHQAFVTRRDLAPEYDRRYRLSADYDWCIRVLKKSPANAYAGPAPIISYLADGMTTRHHRASLWERYRIMCHHYGTWRATLAHLGFIPRYMKRRLSGSANVQ